MTTETTQNTENTDENNTETTESPKYTVRDLVTFAGLEQPLDFTNAYNTLMANRLQVAVDAKATEIKANLFTQPSNSSEA